MATKNMTEEKFPHQKGNLDRKAETSKIQWDKIAKISIERND